MKKHLFFLPAFLALVLLLTACASPQAATSVPTSVPPTPAPPTSAPAPAAATAPVPVTGGAATVNMTSSADFGPILVDDKGMSLYLFLKDTPNTNASSCYDKCAANWPPLLTSGAPQAGAGVDTSKFGTLQRTDGTTQVTYNGWPLYYFAKDAKAGDMNGQGIGDVWFLISPSGDQAGQSAAPTQAAPPAMPPTVKPPAY
jgi:predicted lipoprotein with Yx(FWY)xxD motif